MESKGVFSWELSARTTMFFPVDFEYHHSFKNSFKITSLNDLLAQNTNGSFANWAQHFHVFKRFSLSDI